ncbi:MAG: VWA domain-containing protein, partial [Congregibacter sp.]|nr:VWA domain-containing protein [Congregibacter sp.]
MNEFLANFHFLRPYWLLLMLPCAVFGLLLWRQKGQEAGWSRIVAPELLEHLMSPVSLRRSRSGLPALLLAWAIAVLAAAGPSWQQLPQPVLQKQDALVLVVDLSYSMLATDLSPSRQDRVRRKLLDLLRDRREGLTALIAYAGDAHIVAPLTDDNPTIANLLPALTPEMMPLPGSNPVDAMERAIGLLDSAGVRRGRILLVTDGIRADELGTLAGILAG